MAQPDNQSEKSQRPYKILVVDDDEDIRVRLRRALKRYGYEVVLAEDGVEMNQRWREDRYDLVVLDWMMPGKEDGMEICQRLRRAGNDIPIIMLTAKGTLDDRVFGLREGADDYLPKPFDTEELVARIEAVLRRKPPADIPGAPSKKLKVIRFDDFELNLQTRTLKKGGETISLSTGDFAILKALAENANEPVSANKLFTVCKMKGDFDPEGNDIRVAVSRLRKKIPKEYLQTVHGQGYMLVTGGREENS